jgi:hypothetical protein
MDIFTTLNEYQGAIQIILIVVVLPLFRHFRDQANLIRQLEDSNKELRKNNELLAKQLASVRQEVDWLQKVFLLIAKEEDVEKIKHLRPKGV